MQDSHWQILTPVPFLWYKIYGGLLQNIDIDLWQL